MEKVKTQLLELIRCGLWEGTPDTTLFEKGVNWKELLNLAHKQTLLGVVSAAIEKLPATMRPNRNTMLYLHKKVTLNRQFRTHHFEVLADMLELLKRAGAERPVLLKGLGVGMNYPEPSLRQCGDIDIYVGPDLYEGVCEFLCCELGVTREIENDIHLHFMYKGTEVEIHKYAVTVRSIAYHREEFVAWCTEHLEGDNLREVDIEGIKVYLPPYDFDFIYIFYHTWKHFLSGGIGLRQVCDWCCYIDKFHDKIDKEKITKMLSVFKLECAISIFATIAVEELGLKREKFLNYSPANTLTYKKALDKIWEGGNFGYYRSERKTKSRTVFTRKIRTSISMFNDMRFIFKIDPLYAINFYRVLFKNRIAHTFRNRHKLKRKL